MLRNFRKRAYEIIEVSGDSDKASHVYDIGMVIVIFVSLLPLATKSTAVWTRLIDHITVTIFLLDYLLRLFTADFKFANKGAWAFVLYPFSPMAIIDLLSILPSFVPAGRFLKTLRLFRLFRSLRVFRVFKLTRYSRNVEIIIGVLKAQRGSLTAVCGLAAGYILVSALVVFNIEPDTFDSFFEAIYWATVSLTTVGYGDIYPITPTGQIVTMVSSIFGIAIIALPAGIITAGYMDYIGRDK